jgi:hypothetical protein
MPPPSPEAGHGEDIPAGQHAASAAYASFMALFAVSLTLPVRLASRQPGSVLAGRLENRLPAEVGGQVLDARLASRPGTPTATASRKAVAADRVASAWACDQGLVLKGAAQVPRPVARPAAPNDQKLLITLPTP